ncbi:hypothetical protein [Huintestinicola sp.]|uniref:hypothetical protein n=1 Tax=Huintestinicola sp. TaxID=2981661 RepID=UPI003D7F15C3
MPYPIITPSYFQELAEDKTLEEKVQYNILTSPSAVEYVFPIYQKPLLKKLMSITDVLSFKMTNLKPEHEEEFAKQGAAIVEQYPQLKHYWEFKVLTMQILQNRNFVFEKRMLLLNYAYKTLQGMLDKTEGEEQDKYIATFLRDMNVPKNQEAVMKYFESITPNFAYSLCDGLSLLRALPTSEEYDKLLETVFASVNCDRAMKEFKFDKDVYMPMKKAYYEDFLKSGREHYIEQVMVNYVWTYCMPYADCTSNLWDNFIFFNTLFNTIKVLLTCATYKAEDKDEAFINAITEFDKALRRTKGSIVKLIAAANAKEGLATNGDMAILSMS